MRAAPIDGVFWEDVDTPEALRHTEAVLFDRLGKPTDGVVSRHFNRKVSRRLSRLLVRTPLTPNHISLMTLGVSLLAAWCVAQPAYLWLAAGGLLFQLASIVDGCDGEVAKLKYLGSRSGEWIDTIADNISYVVFFLVPVERRNWFHRVCHTMKFASRRDFFAAVFCVLFLANAREAVFWTFTVGTFLIAAGILVYAGHMMRSRGFWPSAGAVVSRKLIYEKAD
jgi:hypothetical protein